MNEIKSRVQLRKMLEIGVEMHVPADNAHKPQDVHCLRIFYRHSALSFVAGKIGMSDKLDTQRRHSN